MEDLFQKTGMWEQVKKKLLFVANKKNIHRTMTPHRQNINLSISFTQAT